MPVPFIYQRHVRRGNVNVQVVFCFGKQKVKKKERIHAAEDEENVEDLRTTS